MRLSKLRGGDKISSADGRRRDKMLAVGICLLTNIVYWSQHCPWHLGEYEELDSAYAGKKDSETH